MAETIVHDPTERASLPPSFAPSPQSEVVVLSDLWSPIADVHAHHRAAFGERRARPRGADRRSGRGDLPVLRPHRVRRSGGRALDHGRPRRSLARGVSGARRAPPRRDPRRDRPARLELHHPPHRPAGERASARAAHPHGRRAARHRRQPLPRRLPRGAPHDRGLPLGFAQPLVLLGLLSLPVLWWLLRLIPPRPRVQKLGSEKLLLDILPKEETPARTPWWLTLLRLTLAALLIIAAAGPLWNPPLATSQASAPLALLIDDGWAAAATWDTRIRTAEDLIARAETDGRGVAIIALSEVGRDISLETPGAARVRLRQLKPKPHSVDRTEALPAITRFLAGAPSSNCCGSPTASMSRRARSSSPSSASCRRASPITVVEGGVAPAHALTAADNAAGSLTVKVLRAGLKRQRHRPRARARPEGPAARRGAVRLQGQRARDRSRVRPAGRNPQRHRAARNCRRALGRRGATARQALAPPHDRRRHRLDRRYRAAAARLDLSISRARSTRSPTCGSPSAARPRRRSSSSSMQNLPMLILADVGNVGEARERLGKWIDEGGVLVRFAGPRLAAADDDLIPVKLRRGGRTLGGSLSLGAAAAARGVLARKPVQHHAGAERRDGDASGAGRAGLGPDRPHLGDARRRHAAGHRGAARQGRDRAVPRDRRHALVRPAAVGRLRRHAQAHRRARRLERECRDGSKRRRAREAVPANRVLDGFGAFTPPPSTARPVAAGYSFRATADHPPGFYGPPEGLLAVNTLIPTDRLTPLDYAPLSARLEAYRLGEPKDLRGPLFMAALALLVIDALVVFWLAGGLYRLMPRRRAVASALVLGFLAATLLASHALAQGTPPAQATPAAPPDPAAIEFAKKMTIETRLAYILTGDTEVDNVSKAGLAGADAVPRAAHRARGRRSGRARPGARRACVLPADLLADRAECGAPIQGRADPHRRLHEAGRHGAVRHARRRDGAARTGRREPLARHAGAARHPGRRSTSPSSSRCRATTC